MKKIIVLTNIGSPEELSLKAVRQYLKKFLMDPEVITLPFLFRWILVHLIIVPFRAPKSLANYAKIWDQGSPLVLHSHAFRNKLQALLSSKKQTSTDDWEVKMAFNFTKPTLPQVVGEIVSQTKSGHEPVEVTVIPLFPQYAQVTTFGTLNEISKSFDSENAKLSKPVQFKTIRHFWSQDFFLNYWVNELNKIHKAQQGHLSFLEETLFLFSYHGLPEAQIQRDPKCHLGKIGLGESESCCDKKEACERMCYRAQCLQTTAAINQKLSFKINSVTTFQSRLGRTEWIKPYTVDTVRALDPQKIKRLVVLTPAFVSDCLETLEEINMELREVFNEHGANREFIYIPCPNSQDEYCEGFADFILKN